jgi:hypothetical protein
VSVRKDTAARNFGVEGREKLQKVRTIGVLQIQAAWLLQAHYLEPRQQQLHQGRKTTKQQKLKISRYGSVHAEQWQFQAAVRSSESGLLLIALGSWVHVVAGPVTVGGWMAGSTS